MFEIHFIPSFVRVKKVKKKKPTKYDRVEPEDVGLITELYKTMSIQTIADKFDTSVYRIKMAIQGARIPLRQRKADAIRKEIASKGGIVDAEEMSKRYCVEQYYIYKVRKLMGYPPNRLPKLSSDDFFIVGEVNKLRNSGMSLVESCAMAGCTVNTYHGRRRALEQKKCLSN